MAMFQRGCNNSTNIQSGGSININVGNHNSNTSSTFKRGKGGDINYTGPEGIIKVKNGQLKYVGAEGIINVPANSVEGQRILKTIGMEDKIPPPPPMPKEPEWQSSKEERQEKFNKLWAKRSAEIDKEDAEWERRFQTKKHQNRKIEIIAAITGVLAAVFEALQYFNIYL